jgi:hypothetical protein
MLGAIEINQGAGRARDQPSKACRLGLVNQSIRISIFQTAQLVRGEPAIVRQVIGIMPPGMWHR